MSESDRRSRATQVARDSERAALAAQRQQAAQKPTGHGFAEPVGLSIYDRLRTDADGPPPYVAGQPPVTAQLDPQKCTDFEAMGSPQECVGQLLKGVSEGDEEAKARLHEAVFFYGGLRGKHGTGFAELISRPEVGDDPRLGDLFARWLVRGTDQVVVEFALSALAQGSHAPPRQVLEVLGREHNLLDGVTRALRQHHRTAEATVMALVQRHECYCRIDLLRVLESVSDPAHHEWLLEHGHEGCNFNSWSVEAAILGRLLDAMRRDFDNPGQMERHLKLVSAMANAGGPRGVKSLEDYSDGPAVIALVAAHLAKYGLSSTMPDLWWVMRFLEDRVLEDPPNWSYTERARLARDLAAAGIKSTRDEDTVEFLCDDLLRDLKDLTAGDLTKMYSGFSRAVDYHAHFTDLVHWAEGFLELHSEPERRKARRLELLDVHLVGFRIHKLAAEQQPVLGSVYAQVLLQSLGAIRYHPPLGERLVQVALDEEIPLVVAAAQAVVAIWDGGGGASLHE
jgi:hypothetical protein